MKNALYWAFCCGILLGCTPPADDEPFPFGPGATDFNHDFGNGCELIQFSAQIVQIGIDGSFADNKCIPAKVVRCNADANYVIAEQQLLTADKRQPLWGQHQYWIIDAKAKQRHGPFTLETFNAKRKELGVPDDLKLRRANSFRK